MDKVDCTGYAAPDPIGRILRRQAERKKAEDKFNLDPSTAQDIEKFLEEFKEKQKEIEKDFELTESLEHDKLLIHFTKLNEQILQLQKFYSNATIFLRIYDKKVCQSVLHVLQVKLQELENRLLPKKKFGFKTRKNKVEHHEVENGVKKTSTNNRSTEGFQMEDMCGFGNKENEVLVIKDDEVEKKDVYLTDIKNCSVKVYGNPSTLHITNLQNCHVYCGPVSTSVFVENVKDSFLHLACQQLRIHDTIHTDFFVHVTSKAIIEDSKDVRFGKYQLSYEGIDEHYKSSGLSRDVNNWDKIDDFNWLAVDKPSPNWSKLLI